MIKHVIGPLLLLLAFATKAYSAPVCDPKHDLATQVQNGIESGHEKFGRDPDVTVYRGVQASTLIKALHHWDNDDPADDQQDAGADQVTFIYEPGSDHYSVYNFMVISKKGCITNIYIAHDDYFIKFLKRIFPDA